MKPAAFEYHAPTTIEEALELLATHGDEARPLAGGQSLVPLMALRMSRAEHLIDLNRVPELVGVARENGKVSIGAMTRQAALEHHPVVAEHLPLVSRATPLIGHFQIRNRGTFGGSLAHADPAAEYPAVALAMDAELEIRSADEHRRVPASQFFEGMWTTCLAPGELLTRVHIPARVAGEGFAIEEVSRRHGDFAMVGAAVRVKVEDGEVARCAIALFGMAPTPVRAGSAEATVSGQAATIDPQAVGELAVADLHPTDDLHASAAYRRRVGAVTVRRALAAALEEACRD